jgi:hypothetical protein
LVSWFEAAGLRLFLSLPFPAFYPGFGNCFFIPQCRGKNCICQIKKDIYELKIVQIAEKK